MNMTKKRLLHIAVTLALVALGVLGMFVLTSSKPQIKKQKQTVPVPMVRTIKVKTGPQIVHISGEGTVGSLQQIDLVPQVTGEVVYASPALVNGGAFHKGETLLRIDPVDYRLAVTLARAKVKNAESLLQLAEEEAAAAGQEWRLYHAEGSNSDSKPSPLVVKEPQLAAAKARLEAERADLSIAMLNLERTEIKAPFEGRVGQENVDSGQYVPAGKALATIYSTEMAEIVVPLEDDKAFWFHIPGFTPGKGPGSNATVLARIAGQKGTWPAKVVRTEGKMDERTRMINVVIQVEKPYAKKPPLAVGLFVTIDIEGRTLPKASIIPRSALHQDNTVWVLDKDDRIRFRKVDVALLQGDKATVRDGIEDGERLVITPLKAVTDGMAVQTLDLKESGQK
jgi:RND family efflux transporter MFP subunit